jgi:hypothetical protein
MCQEQVAAPILQQTFLELAQPRPSGVTWKRKEQGWGWGGACVSTEVHTILHSVRDGTLSLRLAEFISQPHSVEDTGFFF